MVNRKHPVACAATLNMLFLKFVVFIWTPYALALDSDAKCPKGHRVNVKNKHCEPCPRGYFQDEEKYSQLCKPCRNCDENTGSVVVEACTSVTNTKCKCLETFVPWVTDSAICKCAHGYVASKQFKGCVKVEEKSQTKATTSNKLPHLLTSLTSPRPQEGARTQKPPRSTTTTFGRPGSTTTTKGKTNDSNTSSIVLGLIFLMIGLLVLTALFCKQNMLPHMKRKPEHISGSSFRTPVEESGDGSQDSLKQNQEEP